MIDARCHGKQNGKYNLAFSWCGDNGANACWRHGREQTARLVIRQERFGATGRAGEGGAEGKGRRGGRGLNEGREVSPRSSVTLSRRDRSVLGSPSLEARARSGTPLPACLSRTLAASCLVPGSGLSLFHAFAQIKAVISASLRKLPEVWKNQPDDSARPSVTPTSYCTPTI